MTAATLLQPDPRVRVLRSGEPDPDGRCVLYWMQRAQRGRDNPALNLAVDLGNALKLPVLAVFAITPHFPGAEARHYRFLVDGLPDTAADLRGKHVPFVVRVGDPDQVIPQVAQEVGAAFIVADDNPLRVGMEWRANVGRDCPIPSVAVDADVVVPSSLFPKEEFAARTLRPKMHKVWDDYLKPIPNPRAHVAWPDNLKLPDGESTDPDAADALMRKFRIGGVGAVAGYTGGSVEAGKRLRRFLMRRLPKYAAERNEPTPYCTSELSAHLHFGMISPTTIALAVRDSGERPESIAAYLEELIVRRELSINFVARNPNYDRLAGCPDWGRKTLAEHADDPRPVVYSARQLEAAETGDEIWNASQKEMMLTGRMHNFLRMYWVKKILEWSPDAEAAFDIARELNDRYEMDGRDPNGYTGISWGIGGRHDRPWGRRPIFGTIRYMSHDSTGRKFAKAAYLRRIAELDGSPAPRR